MSTGKKLLETTQAGTLLVDTPKGIVTASKADLLSYAFEVMIHNKILSVPLYDPSKHSFTAFIDMVDIVSFCMEKMSKEELAEGNLTSLMESAIQFKNVDCGQIADISKRNPYAPVESSAPLLSVIQLMSNWSVHRVPIVDAEGELITIITQSHIMRFLYQHMYMFGDLAGKTLESLHMIHNGVVSVPLKRRAMDAFKVMHDQKVSAVAIVDHAGKLVGNISASDLKVIGYDGALLSRLAYPISQFLKILSTENKEAMQVEGPIFVKPSSTFREVMEKLITMRIHRVYIVDHDHKPQGVVSQLEVLRCLASYVYI